MLKKFLSLTTLVFLYTPATALPPLPSFYDSDEDGLIEIHTLQDLNRIPKPGGEAPFANEDFGCPDQQCTGYELANDLDFDSNGDGQFNENDEFWNDGYGWIPASLRHATFEGNGYAIKNLVAKNSKLDPTGLFAFITSATIRNLAINGPLTYIKGSEVSGILAGVSFHSTLEGIYVSGRVEGNVAGGIIGSVSSTAEPDSFTHLKNVLSTATVEVTGGLGGGAFGFANYVKANALLSISTVTRIDSPISSPIFSFGGISAESGSFSNSYWSTDFSGIYAAGSGSEGGDGYTLAELKCATLPDAGQCGRGTEIYFNWLPAPTESSENYWSFANAGDLPTLVLNGRSYPEKEYPQNQYSDIDNDGIPDALVEDCEGHCPPLFGLVFDQFPDNPAFSVDTDMDGLADSWNPSCDELCQSENIDLLDTHPNDFDNDGLPDNIDPDDNNDGVVDADEDSDGYIEIRTLADLDALRFDPTALGRRNSESQRHDASGCPSVILNNRRKMNTCKGYELVVDLDFDTNQNGLLDSDDHYWREGLGWISIHSYNAILNGNGFAIRNLHGESLFGSLDHAKIFNLAIAGPLMNTRTSPLAMVVHKSTIHSIFVSGKVGVGLGNQYHPFNYSTPLEMNNGGLISFAYDSYFSNIFSSAYVEGSGSGGILGSSENSIGEAVLATNSAGGGLVGPGAQGQLSDAHFDQSYWVNRSTPHFPKPNGSNLAASLDSLQCPTGADDTACISRPIYVGWADQTNSLGQPIWDFGDDSQLPGLLLNGKLYRDSDGDGYLDEDDAFPSDFAFAVDADEDGVPDEMAPNCGVACQLENNGIHIDKFPAHAIASLDNDNDGFPDQWNTPCSASCQEESGLTFDHYPEDSDNDGGNNAEDSDDNNDGITDADADSNGLIEIYTLAQLDAVRYSLAGHGRKMSENAPLDSSGCPDGLCVGYELMNNLDFDTNRDGVVNEQDEIWNSPNGWLAIGAPTNMPFTGVFDGRGNALLNFTTQVGDQDFCGLFSVIQHASVRRLAIQGSVNCPVFGGFLAAKAFYSTAEGIALAGDFNLLNVAGGTLFGEAFYSTAFGILASVSTPSFPLADGRLIANGTTNRVDTALITQTVLAPRTMDFGQYERSYWALDQGVTSDGITTATIEQLRCPTAPNNLRCAGGMVLYEQWNGVLGRLVEWDFGGEYELPALLIGNKKYRDTNLDGKFEGIYPPPRSSSSSSSQSSSGDRSSSRTHSSSSSSSRSDDHKTAGNLDVFLFLGLFGFVIGVKLRKRIKFI